MSIVEFVIETAKEMILEKGEHLPALYIEYKGETPVDLCLMAVMPATSLARQKHLFLAGRSVGLAHTKQEVKTLCFAHEAWMAAYAKDKPRPYKQASDDPNRKEILLIEVAEVATEEIKQSLHIYEILRAGDTIDLLPDQEERKGVHSHLLMAFLAGLVSAKMNDRELDALIRTYTR